jgi:hypothetical protein
MATKKQTLLFSEFSKKVKAIAEKNNRTYYSTKIEFEHHQRKNPKDDAQRMIFTCYIDGYGHHDGKTISESINKLKNKIQPKKQVIPKIQL